MINFIAVSVCCQLYFLRCFTSHLQHILWNDFYFRDLFWILAARSYRSYYVFISIINIESTTLATRNIWNTIVTRDAMSQASKELRKQYGKVKMRHSRADISYPYERLRLIAASGWFRRTCTTTDIEELLEVRESLSRY